MIGQKFGRLTVIEAAKSALDTRGRNLSRWLVKCDCGVEKIVRQAALRQGHTKSCGCIQKEKAIKHIEALRTAPNPDTAAKNDVKATYKYEAKKRGIAWDLADEEFTSLILSDCFYCGSSPSNKSQRRYKNGMGFCVYSGIDRKDNLRGYTPENVVPCCKICNRMKSSLTMLEFIKHLGRLAKNLKNLGQVLHLD